MARIPRKVRKTLLSLKKKHEHYVEVKVIKGLFCVFESVGRYDPVRKRAKKITHYLGRILPGGKFVEANHRKPRYAEVTKPEEAESGSVRPEAAEIRVPDDQDLKLLTALSMNGRATYAFLGRLAGMTKNTAYNRVKHLTKRYGIRYLAEIDLEKLGYLSYITLVKFIDKKPGVTEIRQVMEAEAGVQLVLMTSGEYDMVVYFIAKNARDVAYFMRKMQTESALNKYTSRWYTTTAFNDYGFIPLRHAATDVLRMRVWNRSRERPQPQSDELTSRDAEVLIELNGNGAVDFAEIDRRHGYDSGAALYSYYKLRKKGILKRITVSLENLNIRYNAVILANIFNGKKLEETRVNLTSEVIRDSEVVNKYALVSDIQVPSCVMFIMPVFADGSVQSVIDYLDKNVDGIENKMLIVTEVVLGSFCFRRFDKAYSVQYQRLVQIYKTIEPMRRVVYEEQKESMVPEEIDLGKI